MWRAASALGPRARRWAASSWVRESQPCITSAWPRCVFRLRPVGTPQGQRAEDQAIVHVGSWEWGIASRAVTWSDEQCRLLGIPVGSRASYEGCVARVRPDDRDGVEGIGAQGLAERQTKEYEWRL